jgi:dipeptidyl aminopeptidase/acylaminoacyl peptidase
MTDINHFVVKHYIQKYGLVSNELLILEPENKTNVGTILFLHGHQIGTREGAWESLRYLGPLLTQGYKVIVPSILGYGKTIGEPDYSGPDTIKRLENTVRNFITEPVHVVGASRGGALAFLFAEHFPEFIKSCTGIAGTYDLEFIVNQTTDEKMKLNILNETGGTTDAYKMRDPKTLWKELKMPLHIIHGSKDEQIPHNQAEMFSDFLKKKGLKPKLTILETSGHKLFSAKFFFEVVIPFLETA